MTHRTSGMVYHPYLHQDVVDMLPVSGNHRLRLAEYLGGGYVHNPVAVGARAIGGVMGAVGYGVDNFNMRHYRRSAVPVNFLTKSEHKRPPVQLKRKVYEAIKPKSKAVVIPTVSNRRTKSYKNKILSTNKAMPYRRVNRRFKKRTYKKRRGGRRRVHKIPLGIPRTKLVRLRTVAVGTLSATTGTIATNILKANSINDPTGSLSTYIPHLVDQYAAMYQKYICLGSKIKIRFGISANTGAGVVGIHLADNNTALSNTNEYRMLPRTKQCILTTQKDFCTIVMTYSGKKFWNLQSLKDDSEQEASFSVTPGDPTDLAYYHIYCNDLYGTATFTVDYQVEFEHILMLSDPTTAPVSVL